MSNLISERKPEEAENITTHPFTCNTCQVAFRNSDLQRGHMRSDWHRYNLKRRITSLPPISSEIFTEKVLHAQAISTAALKKETFENTCSICARTYFSENAYRNHIGSQRHKSKLATTKHDNEDSHSVISSTFSLGEPVADLKVKEIVSDNVQNIGEAINNIELGNRISIQQAEKEPKTILLEKNEIFNKDPFTHAKDKNFEEKCNQNRCLFCNFLSDNLDLNVKHMEKVHGMFIPERPFLVDLEGLIDSLYEKMFKYHECFYCKKLKTSQFGLQTHMRDKGHCKIPFFTEEEQLEIGEFYDFTSTYSGTESEAESEEKQIKQESNTSSPGSKLEQNDADSELDEDDDRDGWETDCSGSTINVSKLTKKDHQKSEGYSNDTRLESWSNDEKNNLVSYYNDYELHLPSGRTAGHRSLNRYFKQNLHNHPSPMEQQEELAIKAINISGFKENYDIDSQSSGRKIIRGPLIRNSDALGIAGISAQKIKELSTQEKRSRKVEERGRRRNEWLVNKQNNSQKHFRDPLLQ
ncbi:unnamed protein product [Blumeria hordei]|uniref:C2H2-type domain-containing protein n=1 Tax=Blumeria hordei TaxID=2867405 RepID=A0A383V1W8_BLUHO|nr:unnamed protein product [Blumeria hordei]